jgi:hypothetical protein
MNGSNRRAAKDARVAVAVPVLRATCTGCTEQRERVAGDDIMHLESIDHRDTVDLIDLSVSAAVFSVESQEIFSLEGFFSTSLTADLQRPESPGWISSGERASHS